MKKKIMAFAGLLALGAFGITASQEWVKDFVARLNGSTNEVLSTEVDGCRVEMSYQLKTERAIMVTNSVEATLPDGTLFAYTSNGVFTNKVVGSFIRATATNLVWNGIGSRVENGFDRFDGHFSVAGGLITLNEAEGLK